MSDRQALVTTVARLIFDGEQNLDEGGRGSAYQRRKAEEVIAEVAKATGERIAVEIVAHWTRDGNNDAAAQYQATVDADIARADTFGSDQ